MLSFIFAQVKTLEEAAPAESLTRDSAILGEGKDLFLRLPFA